MSKNNLLYDGDSSEDEDASFTIKKINEKIDKLRHSDKLSYLSSYLVSEISQSIVETARPIYKIHKQNFAKKVDNKSFYYQGLWLKYLIGIYLHDKNGNKSILDSFYERFKNEVDKYLLIKTPFLKQNVDEFNEKLITYRENIKYAITNNFILPKDAAITKDLFLEDQEVIKTIQYQIFSKYFQTKRLKTKENITDSQKTIKDFFRESEYVKLDSLRDKYQLKAFLSSSTVKKAKEQMIDEVSDALAKTYIKDIPLLFDSDSTPLIEQYIKSTGATKSQYAIKLVLKYEEQQIKQTTHLNQAVLEEHLVKDTSSKNTFKNSFIDHLVDKMMEHRLIRGKEKVLGVENTSDTLENSTLLPSGKKTVSTVNISKNGNRADYKILPLNHSNSSSYEEMFAGKYINNKSLPVQSNDRIEREAISLSKKEVINIIKNQPYTFKQQDFKGRLVDLLFNCETERNASAFLTNAMFFDLVEADIYKINELPDKLPMAMKGAVDATRDMLDTLGGTYGGEKVFLTKRQHYDFGTGDSKDVEELAARDTAILLDWIYLQLGNMHEIFEGVSFEYKGVARNLMHFIRDAMTSQSIVPRQEDDINTFFNNVDKSNEYLDLSKKPTENRRENLKDWQECIRFVNERIASLFNNSSVKNKIFKAFHNLVYEWYEIRLDWLYSFEQFKKDNKEQFFKNLKSERVKEPAQTEEEFINKQLQENLIVHHKLKLVNDPTFKNLLSNLKIDVNKVDLAIKLNEDNYVILLLIPESGNYENTFKVYDLTKAEEGFRFTGHNTTHPLFKLFKADQSIPQTKKQIKEELQNDKSDLYSKFQKTKKLAEERNSELDRQFEEWAEEEWNSTSINASKGSYNEYYTGMQGFTSLKGKLSALQKNYNALSSLKITNENKFSQEIQKYKSSVEKKDGLLKALELLKVNDNMNHNQLVATYISVLQEVIDTLNPTVELRNKLQDAYRAISNSIDNVDTTELHGYQDKLMTIFDKLIQKKPISHQDIRELMELISDRDYELKQNFTKEDMGQTATARKLLLTCLNKENQIEQIPICKNDEALVDIVINEQKLTITNKSSPSEKHTIELTQDNELVVKDQNDKEFVWIANGQYKLGHHFVVYPSKDKILGQDQNMGLNGNQLDLTLENIKDILFGDTRNKNWGKAEEMILIAKDKISKPPSEVFDTYSSVENKNNNCWFASSLFISFLVNGVSLKGTGDYYKEDNVDYIDSYFSQYTLGGLSDILDLRLKDLKLKNIKTLQGVFIDQKHNNFSDLITEILNGSEDQILVPLNLFNKHATGLILEKTKSNSARVKYIDTENKAIPVELLEIIKNALPNVLYEQIQVEQQKYSNCGPEVIENFILYLTGKRVCQEKAIELHSKLVENALLGIKSSGTHLLFEELANYYQQPENNLEPNKGLDCAYNSEIHNFDYGNNDQQTNLLGQDHYNAI